MVIRFVWSVQSSTCLVVKSMESSSTIFGLLTLIPVIFIFYRVARGLTGFLSEDQGGLGFY